MKKKIKETILAKEQHANKLKSSGLAISRKEIHNLGKRSYQENESLIVEAENEQKVLRMKKFYLRRGWDFPPKTMSNATTVHLLNVYYGKEVCKHTPKDKLEKKLNV